MNMLDEVFELIAKSDVPLNSATIADMTGYALKQVRNLVWRLKTDGRIVSSGDAFPKSYVKAAGVSATLLVDTETPVASRFAPARRKRREVAAPPRSPRKRETSEKDVVTEAMQDASFDFALWKSGELSLCVDGVSVHLSLGQTMAIADVLR